jgi:Na+-transporting methylmalonyl-CoA/oxaloacetate decarboxylase gamma subunit
MDLSNVFNTGGMVTGIGLLIVFGCLIALIVIIVLLPKVLNVDRTKKRRVHPATPGAKTAPAIPKPQARPMPPEKDDHEFIAVIFASVAAMMDTHPGKIVVRSYKRISPSAWKKSGRNYQIFLKI